MNQKQYGLFLKKECISAINAAPHGTANLFRRRKTLNEKWDDETQREFPTRKILIAVLLIACIVVPVGAVYKIMSPPSDPVVVTEPATLSKPTVNATNAIPNDKLIISTTLSDKAPGVQVFFYENDIQIGSASTDSNGVATYQHTIASVGTKVYYADCIHS